MKGREGSVRLEGKSAIITGSGSGVGRAAALRFAQEGAKLVCADIDAEGAAQTVKLVEEQGGTATAVRTDVSVESDVIAMIDAAVSAYGRLDILFNNVGVPTPRLGSKLEDHTVEDFDRLTSINFKGVFLGCKYAVLKFKEQGGGGVILNTGSVAGLVGWGGTVYGATKGAVHQLTKAIAVEAAGDGIRVNAICPAGMPYTGFMGAGGLTASAEDLEKIAAGVGSTHPLGRPILAEDCAEAAVFLCSDAASNITGVLLPVDGGYVAR
ncbi:MAG TPA: SDR family oxidoreductase [Mycobacteriales bacterium]|nr:SDR family oxidoreductase [Mycobacteriales bacterium]